ncbi:uncharacterized protein LOC125673670 [Ostrea edulis]|uniref:uncharacterized protein LOC125673670 n=1 Tax=Ostrea edulis TaxID=37623 RepID=UPI0024AEF202|nr:uncharacterized protein LOC125673670 [Ostrea edulis]
MFYSGYGDEVDSCPQNRTEFTAAATRLNCTVDKNGYNRYTCVPKLDLKATVEFCYNFTVGFYPKGHCLRVQDDGALNAISCSQFTKGCPTEHYRGSDLYQFPACHQINTEKRCFYANPSCPNQTGSATTAKLDGSFLTDSTPSIFNATTNISSTLSIPVEQGSADTGMVIGIILSVIAIIVVCTLAMVFRKRLWRRYGCKNVTGEESIEMDGDIIDPDEEEWRRRRPSNESQNDYQFNRFPSNLVIVSFGSL